MAIKRSVAHQAGGGTEGLQEALDSGTSADYGDKGGDQEVMRRGKEEVVRLVGAPSSMESLWQAGDGSGWDQKLPGLQRVQDGEWAMSEELCVKPLPLEEK